VPVTMIINTFTQPTLIEISNINQTYLVLLLKLELNGLNVWISLLLIPIFHTNLLISCNSHKIKAI
jgi:hypothetical protein